MNNSLISQIRAFFEARQAIVHSISIRAGKIVARVDDDKLVGTYDGRYSPVLELAGGFSVVKIPLQPRLTVRELILALKEFDQDAVVLVSPWAGSTKDKPVSDSVCVDYISADCWPVKGVLISN